MGPYLATPNLQKNTHNGSHKELRWASCEMQGWRKTMEDADITHTDFAEGMHLFGVFDGHGGSEVSKFVAQVFAEELKKNQNFIKGNYAAALLENFKNMDDMLLKPEGIALLNKIHDNLNLPGDEVNSLNVGCTGNVLLITPNKFYVANAGDSRSVLCNNNSAVALSEDHKPDDDIEISRIQSAGGQIYNGRVNGGLNLTRSIGDFAYKQNKGLPYDQQLIICKPDVKQIPRSEGDEFIVMGCDGIWEKYVSNNQGMVEWLNEKRKEEPNLELVSEKLLDYLIAKETSEEVGCDNMTVIIIEFNNKK